MAVFWYNNQKKYKNNFQVKEYEKLLLKGLLSNRSLSISEKVFFWIKFLDFTKISSLSFYRHYCLFTGLGRSIFRKFKMYRHQCKKYASNGFLVGLRKASF